MSFFFDKFVWLFHELNPIAVALLYFGSTLYHSERERLLIARLGAWIAFGIFGFFALTGEWFFQVLPVGLDTITLASSVILFIVGKKMLADDDPEDASVETESSDSSWHDTALIPLAIPTIASPGAIRAAIHLSDDALNSSQLLSCYLALVLVSFVLYLLFRSFWSLSKCLNVVLKKLIYRLFGLFILAIAVQFLMEGLRDSGVLSVFLKKECLAAMIR